MNSQRESITVSSEEGLTSWASGEHGAPGAFAGALAREATANAAAGTVAVVVDDQPGWVASAVSPTGALAAIVASTGPSSTWQLTAAPGYVLARFLNVEVA
jgi:hypothetical protein